MNGIQKIEILIQFNMMAGEMYKNGHRNKNSIALIDERMNKKFMKLFIRKLLLIFIGVLNTSQAMDQGRSLNSNIVFI